MSVNEAMLGFQFLYGILAPDPTLTGLAPGGISRGMAPPETATPYVIVTLQSPGADSLTLTAVRVLSTPLFQIKVVGPASITQQIANAAAQIDVLLGGGSGLRNQSITGGFIAGCYRESPYQLDELVNGELWTNIGGFYRLQIEQTT